MSVRSNIGPRLDRLPTSKWLWMVFWLIGCGCLIDCFDNYTSGVVLAQLFKNGWSNNYLNAIYTSATMAGFFFGSLFAGISGDHLGRKVAYQVNLIIFSAASIAAAFSSNMTILICFRAIVGFGLSAELVVGYGTFAEFVPARSRGRWTSALSLVANSAPPIASLVGMGLISFLGPNNGWRAIFFIGGILGFVVWIARHAMPESPRWLAAHGDIKKADELLTKVEKDIEKKKGIKLPPVEEGEEIRDSQEVRKIPFMNLFKGKLLKRTILGSCLFIAMNTALYTITTWIPTIFVKEGITVTKSAFMAALMLFGAPCGIIISTLIVDKFPRKWMGTFELVLMAALCYIYAIQKSETAIIVIGFILMTVLYMYTCFACSVYGPELWPTEIRLRGGGLCNSVGRLVTIFSPFGVAWLMTKHGSVSVFIAVASVLLIVAVVVAVLGFETRFKSVEDIANEVFD